MEQFPFGERSRKRNDDVRHTLGPIESGAVALEAEHSRSPVRLLVIDSMHSTGHHTLQCQRKAPM